MDADQCQWVFDALCPQDEGQHSNVGLPIASNLVSLRVGQRGPSGRSPLSASFSGMPRQLWENVKVLELCESITENMDDLLDLLAAFPSITTLVLGRSMKFWGPYEGRKQAFLPHLESVTFKGSPPLPGLHSALAVTAQSLRTFTFCDMTEECVQELNATRRVRFITEHSKELKAWMKGIGSGLTELTLSNNHIYPNGSWLLNCVKDHLLPNLVNLTLLGRCDTDLLLNMLAASRVCPNIERFVCVPDKYEDAFITQASALNFMRVRLGVAEKELGMRMLRYVHIGIRSERKAVDLRSALDISGKADFQGATIKLSYIPPRAVTLTLDNNKKVHKDYN
jgi:hypothetical protein